MMAYVGLLSLLLLSTASGFCSAFQPPCRLCFGRGHLQRPLKHENPNTNTHTPINVMHALKTKVVGVSPSLEPVLHADATGGGGCHALGGGSGNAHRLGLQHKAHRDLILDSLHENLRFEGAEGGSVTGGLHRDRMMESLKGLSIETTAETKKEIKKVWEVVQGSGSDEEYFVLRHRTLALQIELSRSASGLLFAAANGNVRRCWADGSCYDRFAFRTATRLSEASQAQAWALDETALLCMGQWEEEEQEEEEEEAWDAAAFQKKRRKEEKEGPAGVCVALSFRSSKNKSKKEKEKEHSSCDTLYLLSDGFAFVGHGTRGVLVQGSQGPRVVEAEEVRATFSRRTEAAAASVERVPRQLYSTATTTRATPHDIPKEILCGLTGAIMRDPWIASDGFSYEREAIKQWFEKIGPRSPTTGRALSDMRLVPNHALRSLITLIMEHHDEWGQGQGMRP